MKIREFEQNYNLKIAHLKEKLVNKYNYRKK